MERFFRFGSANVLLWTAFSFMTVSSSSPAGSSTDNGGGGGVVGGGVVQLAPADGTVHEYCQWETFEARCGADEVIVISEATYGRPAFGRCIRQEYGYVGCSSNVRRLADAMCSGRQHCRIAVPDKMFDGTAPCREDLKSFLMIGYTCVKVTLPANGHCRNPQPSDDRRQAAALSRRDPTSTRAPAVYDGTSGGLLSSVVSASTGCGSPGSPWLIDVSPGQRVNVTLVDFALGAALGMTATASNGTSTGGITSSAGGPGRANSGATYCQVYAVIKEQRGGQGVTICGKADGGTAATVSGSEGRESVVYLSTTNSIEIRILTARSQQNAGGHFLLRYLPVGCADLAPPTNGWWRRDGDNASEVGCDHHQAHRVWRLTCFANVWVGDRPSECPDQGVLGSSQWLTATHSTTATLILCIAALVGFAVFTAGLCVIQRKCKLRGKQTPPVRSLLSVDIGAAGQPLQGKDIGQLPVDAYRPLAKDFDGRSHQYHYPGYLQPPTGPYIGRSDGYDSSGCNAVDNEYAYVDEVYGAAHGNTACGAIPGSARGPMSGSRDLICSDSAPAGPVVSTWSGVEKVQPSTHVGVCYQYNYQPRSKEKSTTDLDCCVEQCAKDDFRNGGILYQQQQQQPYQLRHQPSPQRQFQPIQAQRGRRGSLPRDCYE